MPTLGFERQETYSPFMPICPTTGRVLQVKIESYNKDNGTVSYLNNDGNMETVKVTGGNCKLQWKPDFGMRWAALEVDYEMYGKDHLPNAKLYSGVCQTLGVKPPTQFFY